MDLTSFQTVKQQLQQYRHQATLVAVSKYQPISKIQALYDAGQRDFGENRVQELLEKAPLLPADIRWHLIGHLQTNKVKYIVDKVHLVHSVDSLTLAEEINKQASKRDLKVDVLIQVNVSGEESKFGCEPRQVVGLLQTISPFPGVSVKGLMTMAPLVKNPEEARPIFRALRELALNIKQLNIPNVEMTYLSMGMSNDYHIAVEQGSNMVRIGSKLFGAREY